MHIFCTHMHALHASAHTCARCMRPAPRRAVAVRAAQPLLGLPLLLLLVVEMSQKTAVKRPQQLLVPRSSPPRLAAPTVILVRGATSRPPLYDAAISPPRLAEPVRRRVALFDRCCVLRNSSDQG